jgi:non-specific serine/threonine protein kinase/serine/threonine-protein kinase
MSADSGDSVQLHREAKRIFAEVVDKPPEERTRLLAQLCAPESAVYQEVLSLLESAGAENFLDQTLPPISFRDPLIERRLGPYKVLRQIGQGGMGAVYLAERADQQFRKQVALKAVRPGLLDQQALRRFQNERQTLAVLNHPNIIQLLDAGTSDDGVPYLVTEYVEGQPLDSFCASRKLGVRQRLELFRLVLGAVHYAHQNLVVHRDLKPGNILVTPAGVPKLLDFGIAKLLRAEFSAHMGLTRTSFQPMTPEFASPEQVLGQPITTASDIYSLGVILYRLLTGRHPFELKTHTAVELERAICETDPEPPSRVAPAPEAAGATDRRLLRGDLDTIVLMAMRKEPQRRYASAEHFSEDVRRFLEGRPVEARKAGVWYRSSKFVTRHKVACALGTIAVAGLLASGAAAWSQKRAAERRFDDLEHFANFMLTDLDDKLREGATPAREAVAAKSLEYLDGLARERRTPAILRDLINGYIKHGDVQGNLYGASMGETAHASGSYRKALTFAEELARSPAVTPADQRNLALAHMKLGEVLYGTGKPLDAIQHYEEALRVNQAIATPNLDALKDRFTLWFDVASSRALLFDTEEALAAYQHALETARAFPSSYSSRASAIALAQEQAAYWSVVAGDPAGAEQTILDSIATYRRAVAANPKSGRRRSLAKAYKNLAEVRKRAGHYLEAIDAIGKSESITSGLLDEDPKSAQYQIDRQQAMMLEVDILNAAGRTAEAKDRTRQALAIMKPLAEPADAPYQHAADYAELLTTTPFADLRDDPAALRSARRALAGSHEADPEVWHVLALADDRNGDPQGAKEARQKALSLLPPVKPGHPAPEFRRLLEAELAK